MDYLPYRRTNNGITILSTLNSVNLAQFKIFRAKFAMSDKGGIIYFMYKYIIIIIIWLLNTYKPGYGY